MANTLTPLIPTLLARGLMLLRKKLILPRLVNQDYSTEAAAPGTVITIPIPVPGVATDVVPGPTPPTPTDQAPTSVTVPLDNWKHKDFHITDKQLGQIDKDKFYVPSGLESAIDALAQAVNISLFAEYKGVFGYNGTAGTTPFATDITGATLTKKTLNQQLAPPDKRRFVIDFAAEANATNLPPFRDASQSADKDVITEGEIGHKLGFDWYSDDDVPTHVAGTGAGYLINNGAGYPIGTKTVTVDTGTGTILVGDIVTFVGVTGTYAVTAALAANAFSFYPGLAVAVADNAAITLKATHVVNLAFHRDAFAFVTRPLSDGALERQAGVASQTMADPKTGLVMRIELMREYKQWVWDVDMQWGVKLVRPELAARLAG